MWIRRIVFFKRAHPLAGIAAIGVVGFSLAIAASGNPGGALAFFIIASMILGALGIIG